MSRIARPLETEPGPECYCGSELKSVPLPADLAALAGRESIWVHTETGDTRCYPDSANLTDATATGEPGMPERIQLKRTAGWRKPDNTVVVARPSRWGNPFRYRTVRGLARMPGVIGGGEWEFEGRVSADGARHDMHFGDGRIVVCHVRYMTRAEVVDCFRRVLLGDGPDPPRLAGSFITWRSLGFTPEKVRGALAGKNLACWCPLTDEFGQPVPCHADVLLEVANA